MKTILALLFINKKKKLFLLAGIIALLIFSRNNCDDIIQEGQDKSKSRLVFYTNAQAILNCGPFDVDIFIGNVPVGSISYSYINDELPDCIQSDNTLLVEKDTGTYSYFAQATYSDIFHWTGTIDIKPDSCHKVFLDVEHAVLLNYRIFVNSILCSYHNYLNAFPQSSCIDSGIPFHRKYGKHFYTFKIHTSTF